MSLRKTVRRQYRAIVNSAKTTSLKDIKLPKEGWISTVRNALGMSQADLGRRVNSTRANISSLERSEQEGRATIQSMNNAARAMNCKFVYAIIPNDDEIETVVEQQARKKAKALVDQATTHMALEKQSLDKDKIAEEIEKLSRDLIENPKFDFWKD